MTTYTPNRFSGQMAQANALRSYTPNLFARQGSAGNTTGALAPHLGVAAADRPYASDVALLQGTGDSGLPDFNKLWNFSPHRYQSDVAKLLAEPKYAGLLAYAKDPTGGVIDYDSGALPAGYTRTVDEEGNVRVVRSVEGSGE